jgi:hypothetical protein
MQVAIVAAVAATGIAFGRWGIPAGDSSPAVSSVRSDTSDAARSDRIIERKFAQMDAQNARHATVADEASDAGVLVDQANVVQIPQSDIERKFAQMDAQAARYAGAAALSGEVSYSDVLGDLANVAPMPAPVGVLDVAATATVEWPRKDTWDVKFAQMDEREARGSGVGDRAGTPADPIERKFAQMDAQAAR